MFVVIVVFAWFLCVMCLIVVCVVAVLSLRCVCLSLFVASCLLWVCCVCSVFLKCGFYYSSPPPCQCVACFVVMHVSAVFCVVLFLNCFPYLCYVLVFLCACVCVEC